MLPTAPAFYLADPKAEVLGRYAHGGKPALGAKKTGKYTAYYSALGGLTAPVFREIARRAGVHLYGETNDPIYVNNRLIGIHLQGQSALTLRLPLPKPVVLRELFDGGEIRVTNGAFQPPHEPGVMKLYLLTDAEIKPGGNA